jgi:ubiquinone/menaquinone biosynthesis C-methylase UbiE
MADKYLFDNAAEKEAFARMMALSALHDAATRRYIEERGIAPGWNCLEIGAGEGAIARWMAERVGPSGHVLATDIDPRFLLKDPNSVPENMEVRLHDITIDPLPENAFDLIHARLVLVWLRDRLAVLDRLVRALRPGGWLVVEDYDTKLFAPTLATADPEAAARFERMRGAIFTLMTERGLDHTYARSLHHRLRERGLEEVGMRGTFEVQGGGSPATDLRKANFLQVRHAAVAAGLISDEEVSEVLRDLDNPTSTYFTVVMMSAWGRKPKTE